MATENQKLPIQITDYINDHFREDFLFEVKEVKQLKDHVFYTVEVTKDDFIHTLEFNEKGVIVKKDAVPAFPPDIHEEPGFGDVPD